MDPSPLSETQDDAAKDLGNCGRWQQTWNIRSRVRTTGFDHSAGARLLVFFSVPGGDWNSDLYKASVPLTSIW